VVNQVWNSPGAVTTLVTFPKWWNALQEISFYLNNAWQGQQTPQQALTQAVQKVEALGTLTF
jgi:maltose-binding protein MalE